ncbi:MAG TPA: hypothetical protein VMO76_14655 [Candidatus Udaeobacter sp.]|jgi:hypothetical protein|nr:hypothetical protein [Candidatus Udaeobacter sp.]
MQQASSKINLPLAPVKKLFSLGIILLTCSISLLANTPGMLRSLPSGGCYCRCSESHQRGGCVKLCDSKRYASRWWAKKCVKPHMQTPTDNPNAGPRFPHPGKAEHAKLQLTPNPQ